MLPANSVLQERYEIRRPIGQGGSSTVYEAIDQRSGAPVAVKQSPLGRHHRRRSIEREARLLSSLSHPALPTFVDRFETADGYFLVVDLIAGHDLARLGLQSIAPLPVEQVLNWSEQLLDVLAYLHSHRPPIIHRDIKPHNLRVDEHGRLRLLDFGLARGARSDDVTIVGITGFTLRYAPPEQIRGEGAMPCSDLYAVAATLYDLLTGHSPPDALSRLAALAQGEPDPLLPAHERNPSVPPAVSAVLHQAMALAPEKRPSSAAAMHALLQKAMRHDAPISLPQDDAGPAVTPPHNLPLLTDSLFGRDEERANIQRLLRRDEVRLITLTGPGGVGKTQLALQAAHDALPLFDDGVYFVELAPLRDARLVLPAIVHALGLPEDAQREPPAQLRDHLQDKRLLLLLDNFEHLSAAVQDLAQLLSLAGLKLIVTSRHTLRLQREHAFEVRPLGLPAQEALPLAGGQRAAVAAAAPAVQLFLRQAQRSDPEFRLDEDNAQTVAELCARLDGLPLAIELAASRIHTLSPSQILQRVDQQLLLPAGALRTPAWRHTLQAAFDWSYDLLNEDEKRLFRRLAVFNGGWSLQAVQAVCDVDGDLRRDVLQQLDVLAQKSMLRRAAGDHVENRFGMLETVRDYARRHLHGHGESRRLQTQHCHYFLSMAEDAEAELTGEEQNVWMSRLERDHDNFRDALHWALSEGSPAHALRMGAALWRFWLARGYAREGMDWLHQALARVEQMSGKSATQMRPYRAKACNAAAILTYMHGDIEGAALLFRQALDLWQALDDREGVARVLNNLAMVKHYLGDFSAAQAAYEASLVLQREMNDEWGVATVLNNLGNMDKEAGRLAQATEKYEESRNIFQAMNDLRSAAGVALNLAEVARMQGAYEHARRLNEESLVQFQALGERRAMADLLQNQAAIAYDLGELALAADLFEEALVEHEAVDYSWGKAAVFLYKGLLALRSGNEGESGRHLHRSRELSEALSYRPILAAAWSALGHLACHQQDGEQARHYCHEALSVTVVVEDRLGCAVALECLARLERLQGNEERAATLLGIAAAMRAEMSAPLPPVERPDHEARCARLHRALGDEAFETAWQAGEAMGRADLETIASFAREL